MDMYYDLNANPGIQVASKLGGKFKFLELDEIRNRLLLFSNEGVARVRFSLPQIHCSSCLWLLERLHKLNPGVIQSEVYFNDREAEITFKEGEISLMELAELLSAIGYPPDISLQEYDSRKVKKSDRRLIVQIGVVGFCFGNIMLMSFPEYVGIDKSFSNFQRTFNYLNVLFSIPVLLVGAKDYIISSFKALRAKHINIDVPITLGIFALYFRSLYEIFSGVGAGYLDSFAGLIFFLLIGKWFQQKTYKAINFERDYKSYFPIAATRKNDENEEVIPLKKVVVGDRLLIRNNELIPADAVLIEGKGRIDYSFVSGESTEVRKVEGDSLYAGGRQTGTSILVEVVKEVENSYLTRLWNNPVFHKEKESRSLSDNISTYFTIAVIVIALIAGFVWLQIDPQKAPFVVTSVLIVACPCAIALSVPFTHGNIIRQLGRKSFYLRSSKVIDPLNDIDDVVLDKTGTLTLTDNVQVIWKGEDLLTEDINAIFTIAHQSSHPLSRSIFKHFKKSAMLVGIADFEEFSGKGVKAQVEGAQWKMGSAQWIGIPEIQGKTSVIITRNDKYLGRFEFANAYRPGIADLLSSLKKKYKLHLLSGDNASEKSRLSEIIGDDTEMYFDQSPEDKMAYIAHLQESGKKVMMIGDGLNDAGALAQANVGLAVVDDVHTFSPSSDGIIEGKKLRKLLTYLGLTDYGRKVVWMSYGFSLLYNLTGLYFALTGQLTPLIAAILMPLSSISVLLFVTIMINLKSRRLA